MSNFSISTLLRHESVLNYCGPVKSEAISPRDHGKAVEVFVYNTTANIANGAVIIATLTVAAAMLSMVSFCFASLVIGSSAAIHLNATKSLPEIREIQEDGGRIVSVFDATLTHAGTPPSTWQRFGIEGNRFLFGTTKPWAPFAGSINGYGILPSILPTSARAPAPRAVPAQPHTADFSTSSQRAEEVH